MKKVLFIDRDGTIIFEPANEQVNAIEDFRFLPGVITALSRIARETDFELVLITNQDGLGTASFPEETFWPLHNMMLQILKGEGVEFAEIFIDRTFPEDNAPTRKPGTAMLAKYLSQGVDLDSSFVIGDRITDLGLAKNLGCRAIYISGEKHPDALFNTTCWDDIVKYLTSIPRTAHIERKTKETSVKISLNLDGSGISSINTGIGFFDHMLGQIAKHSGMDLSIEAKGDLEIDTHHLIEDVAIVLGKAVTRALGNKKGIGRYGFLVPMDDSLAQVVIDFSGRPWLAWNVEFINEMIGSMPSEMVFHFFKSFSDNAECNINVKAEGENDHHKAEAVFKAFARAFGMAVKRTGSCNVPSTKGSL